MITCLLPAKPIGPIAEGFPGDGDAVDPCLELAGDAKVVHRRADDEDVGAEELVEHVVATLVCDPDRPCRRIRRSDGWQALAVEVRDRIGVKVAPDHFETWDCRFQRRYQRCRKLARSRVSAGDAGVDVEEFQRRCPGHAGVRVRARYLPKKVIGGRSPPASIAFAPASIPFVVSSVLKRSIATSSIIASAPATPPADHALSIVRAAA
jgi:hypothetical protein